MTLTDVAGIIRRGGHEHCFGNAGLPPDVDVSIHTISRNREYAVGLFLRRGGAVRREAIGGAHNLSHGVLQVSLLLRLGRDAGLAEGWANDIYGVIASMGAGGRMPPLQVFAGAGEQTSVQCVRMVYDAPVWLGADARGVFEYVIDVDFYYDVGGQCPPVADCRGGILPPVVGGEELKNE
ncbi:MAG: hypothetical protein FWE44_00375 [Defluviitaleaceae bacterium]|nr:hypothetical protein [Defluviitaleaceae bacterium]